MKDQLNRFTYQYDKQELETPMGKMKLLQFMTACIYAHNRYGDLVTREERDSMPINVELGKKRAHPEPVDSNAPRNMKEYSILVQSKKTNVQFMFRTEGKFKTKDGKSEVYKYSGVIYKKNDESENFEMKTLVELRELTGMKLDCLNTRLVPNERETLHTNEDIFGQKLRVLEGDIEGMLRLFAEELNDNIHTLGKGLESVGTNVHTMNENMITGFDEIRTQNEEIIIKLDQLKQGTQADSMSFGAGNDEEVQKLRLELNKKDLIIKQQADLIVMLQKHLNERM